MARPVSPLLTAREVQLMEILWARGRATADTIRAALPDQPHDSTVRTLMLARFFGGSAEALVLRLIEDEQLSPKQLDQLRESLSQRKRLGGKS